MRQSKAADMSRAADALMQYAGTTIAYGVQGIFSARWLGPAMKGELVVTVQSLTIASAVVLAGLPLAASAAVSRGLIRGRGLVGAWVLLVCQGAVGGGVVVALFRGLLPPTSGSTLIAMALAPVVLGSAAFMTGVAYASGEARAAMRGNVASQALIAGAYLTLWVLVVSPSSSLAVEIWVGLSAVASAVIIFGLRRPLGECPERLAAVPVRWLYSTGLKTLGGQIAFLLNMRLDVIILASLAGTAAAGIYSVAVSVALLVQIVPEAMGLALSRSFGQGVYPEGSMARACRLTFAISIVLAVFVGLAGLALVGMVFGSRFQEAGAMAAVLVLPWALFSMVRFVSQFAIHGLGKAWYQSSIMTFTLVLDTLLLFALAPSLEAWGAVLACAVASVAGGAVNMVYLARWVHVPMARLMLPRHGDMAWALNRIRQGLAHPTNG